MKKKVTVSISKDLLKFVDEVASETGENRSKICNEALKLYKVELAAWHGDVVTTRGLVNDYPLPKISDLTKL